jgi:hypothetical protein
MDKAAALQHYDDALTFSLTYYPTGDESLDRRIMESLWDAGIEIEKQNLRGTEEYNDMILRAEQNARALRLTRATKSSESGPIEKSLAGSTQASLPHR